MNVVEHLLGGADGDRALVVGEVAVTYGELRDRVGRWREGLAAAGIEGGDRVLVWAVNDDHFVAAYLALLARGAVAVPVNPQSPPAVLAREAAEVGARALVAGPTAGEGPRAAGVPVLTTDDLDAAADRARAGGPDPAGAVACGADDPAVLLFTSGTAGMPKPAVLTHGNLAAALASLRAVAGDRLGPDDVALAVIPLFHVFGLAAVVNAGLSTGLTLVLDHYRSPAELARVVADQGVTVLFGPPTMWQALAAAAAAGTVDRASMRGLRLTVSGSAKLDPVIHRDLAERLGLHLEEGYGLTESAAVAASVVGTDAPVGSVGGLMPGVEARLVGPDGDDVLVGDPGELWLRGPMVSPGYLELSDELADELADERADGFSREVGSGPGTPAEVRVVAAADDDGWLHTGDLVVVDDAGHLSVVDRLKDLIIVSGFNVYPGEVEAVLRDHPEVFEAAVVSESDEQTGEAVVAHIVLVPGATAGIDELARHCHDQLARYKVPRHFHFLSALPRGPGGKVRRQDLR